MTDRSAPLAAEVQQLKLQLGEISTVTNSVSYYATRTTSGRRTVIALGQPLCYNLCYQALERPVPAVGSCKRQLEHRAACDAHGFIPRHPV